MIISSEPLDGTFERREWFARQEGRQSVIEGALRNGKSPELVAEFINIPLEDVLAVQKELLAEV